MNQDLEREEKYALKYYSAYTVKMISGFPVPSQDVNLFYSVLISEFPVLLKKERSSVLIA